jgi:uncharacterized protein YjbJ (UPF0337 family)
MGVTRGTDMNKDYINGLGHQLLGAAKSGAGKLIGDAKLAADGEAERAAGEAASAAARSGAPIIGIDQDRIDGVGHQLRGAVKLGYGKLIGDAEIEAAGNAERQSGKLQNEAGSARDELRDASRKPDEPPNP